MTTRNFLLLLIVCVLTACDEVAVQDRLKYIQPKIEDARTVLIEDLTGQNCTNCPNATEIIEGLIKTFGEDKIIPVAVHCGAYGFAGTEKSIGLMNDESKAYGEKIGPPPYQPIGLVNRVGGLKQYEMWVVDAMTELQKTSSIKISPELTYDASTQTIKVTVEVAANDETKGNLQLLLTEDNIIAIQDMSDGKRQRDYIHNHVFRATINGIGGDAVTIPAGNKIQKTYTYNIPADYKPENCTVVMFVYDSTCVLQAAKTKVVKN